MTKPILNNPALRSWKALNEHVMKVENEDVLEAWLAEELEGRRRKLFIHRIHARLARLRLRRERGELAKLQEGGQ